MAKAGLHLTVPCAQCGVAYRQARSDQRYCSQRCAARAWRSRQGIVVRGTLPFPRTCEACAQPFRSQFKDARFCSRLCRTNAYEAARKRARACGPGKRWAAGKEFVPRDKCLTCGTPFYAPPVLRRRGGGKYCSVRCKAKAMTAGQFPQVTNGRRGKGGRRDDLGGRYFRSRWEANWARYLNLLKETGSIIEWEFEPVTFEFEGIKRGAMFYTPDFRITLPGGATKFQEVKGYMDQRSATKLKRMKKYHPAVVVELIDRQRYSDVAKRLAGIIPHWETEKHSRGKAV